MKKIALMLMLSAGCACPNAQADRVVAAFAAAAHADPLTVTCLPFKGARAYRCVAWQDTTVAAQFQRTVDGTVYVP